MTNGFVAILIIKNFTAFDIAVYRCCVINDIDVIDVYFDKQTIVEVLPESNGKGTHAMTSKF